MKGQSDLRGVKKSPKELRVVKMNQKESGGSKRSKEEL